MVGMRCPLVAIFGCQNRTTDSIRNTESWGCMYACQERERTLVFLRRRKVLSWVSSGYNNSSSSRFPLTVQKMCEAVRQFDKHFVQKMYSEVKGVL